ncbi:hypothetical protein FAM09_19120 [Niastella caeni]|uniref:Uncharacterized protein n=1 Tax=Niastella caeni TaxID=2569763 RepID=A0A4V4H0L8_9BACT|nr:hypothetical protein [Niastella caeni]THU37066.1 hypothetical protein FAM09_19120 [Niastella caeni]
MIGKISGFGVVLLLCLSVKVVAQNPNPILTADSLATGNYKDVLNSFFQLAFERLASPDKEIKFTGTPFAVMAKLDTTLLVDTAYLKYRTLRNINYMFALKLDTSFRFNGFASGIKYAIINKRDETVSRAFQIMVLNNPSVKQLFALNNNILAKISAMPDAASAITEYSQFTKGAINFGQLSPPLQATILAASNTDSTQALNQMLLANSSFNMATTANNIYQELKDNFNQNLLWTVGVTDTTYKNQFVFSNIVIHSELIKGLNKFTKAKNDLELNIRSALQLLDDSLKVGRDLKRVLFSFEPGINVAFKTKTTKKSYLEMKFSGGFYHNFSYLYANEDRNRVFLNGTVRVRIMNDIWVPFEVKYDPRNGNLFGFINVRANFKALGSAAKQL